MINNCNPKYITELCKEFTLLTKDEIKYIIEIANMLPHLSEIFEREIFIDIKVHDNDLAVVVAEIYKRNMSIYSNSYLGDLIYRTDEPGVFRTFDLGVITKDFVGVSYDKNKNKIWTKQTVIPIMYEKNIIATMIFEKNLDVIKTDKIITPLSLYKDDETKNEVLESLLGINSENEELQVREGILIFDVNGLLSFSNLQAAKIYQEFGYKTIKYKHFDDLNYSPKTFTEYISNVKEMNSSKMKNHLMIEKAYDGKISIGRKFYRIRVIVRKRKNVNIIMFIDDITEMRRYKNEANSYLVTSQEIHHRIKNNLQTVASLLRLQSRKFDDDDLKAVLEDSINRILSIAVTHELLEKKTKNEVSIREVLDKIKKNMLSCVASGRKKIEILLIGTDFYLDAERSTTVALIVNELIQNSIKYAFPNEGEGRIEVSTISDGKIRLIKVKDNGIGYNPENTRPNSLGLSIVKTYVEEKLSGKLIVETSDEGTETSFAFKI